MVIHDGHFFRAGFRPSEDNSPLIVDADGMIALPASVQSLQPVAWRHSHIFQPTGAVHLNKLPQCHSADCRIPPVLFLVKKLLRIRIGKGLDHNPSLPANQPAVNSTGSICILIYFQIN